MFMNRNTLNLMSRLLLEKSSKTIRFSGTDIVICAQSITSKSCVTNAPKFARRDAVHTF